MINKQIARRRPVLLVASMIPLAVLVAVGLSTLGSARAPDVPRALPPPDAGPVEVGELAPGIVREDPWTPSAIMDGDPWELFDQRDGVAPWREHLPHARYGRDETLGAYFVEDAVLLTEPAPCYHLARVVRGVGVDLDEPAGSRIEAQIMAWLDPPYFTGVTPPDGLRDCQTRDRSQWAFVVEQVQPTECAVPGREVRCFRTADWRHDFADRDVWWISHLVFDASSGDQLTNGELHPDLDVVALQERVADVLCDAEITCGPIRWGEGQLRPLADDVLVALSPGDVDGVEEGLELRLAREVLPTLPT